MAVKIPGLRTGYLAEILLINNDGGQREVYILPFPQAPEIVLYEKDIYRHDLANTYRQCRVVTAFENEEATKAISSDGSALQPFYLETRLGEFVAEVRGPFTPKPPEVVTWGIRVFGHVIANVYRERFAVMTFEDPQNPRIIEQPQEQRG